MPLPKELAKIFSVFNLGKDFDAWLVEMYQGKTKKKDKDLDSIRILYSIAIDLKFGLCSYESYEALFKTFDFTSSVSRPQERLHLALEKNVNLHFYSNNYEFMFSERLSRVITQDNFKLYFLDGDKTGMDDDEFDFPELSEEYREITVAAVRGGGIAKLAYVSTEIDINRILHYTKSSADKFSKAEILNKYLGLTHDENTKLTILYYSDAFVEPTFQPITINSDLNAKDNVYVSYGTCIEKCGRTRSLTGDMGRFGMKERVHPPIAGKPYVYYPVGLGMIRNKEVPSVVNLIDELKRRLNGKS